MFCFSDFFFFNPGLLVARKEVELGVGRLHAIGMKVEVGDHLSISTTALVFFCRWRLLGTLCTWSIIFGHGCIGFFVFWKVVVLEGIHSYMYWKGCRVSFGITVAMQKCS